MKIVTWPSKVFNDLHPGFSVMPTVSFVVLAGQSADAAVRALVAMRRGGEGV